MKKSLASLSSFIFLTLVIFRCVRGDFHYDRETTESYQEDDSSGASSEGGRERGLDSSEDSDETSTSKPNIFVYLPYRPKTTAVHSLTSTSTTRSINNIRNWTASSSKDSINRSSSIVSDSGKITEKQSPGASASKTFPSVASRSVPARVKLQASSSAISYVQQSPAHFGSPPQQNVVLIQDQPRVSQLVHAPPQYVNTPPTIVQQTQPLVLQSPPAQQIVHFAPTSFQPAPLVQAPLQQHVHYVQSHAVQSPPVQVVQSPPVQVVQSPPTHLVQAPQLQVLRSPPPCPPDFIQAPLILPLAQQFAPPVHSSPLVLFSPPRPVRTRTVYTQIEQIPVQTHVQTTTHYSPAMRTVVYDSLGSNPRPVFAPRPKMFASASKMMPIIMPPDSMESMEWISQQYKPPPSKPPKAISTKPPPLSIDGQGILGAGGLVSTLGGRILGTLAKKYFEHEEKQKKKMLMYRGHKILLKALIKRKP